MKTKIIYIFIVLCVGIILIYTVSMIIFSVKFKYHIREKVFNECVDYYIKTSGVVDINLIDICKDRAKEVVSM